MAVLDDDLFSGFLDDCAAVGIDRAKMSVDARAAVDHHTKPKAERYQEIVDLESRWYRSLSSGIADFGVYGDTAYVADLWACWIVYSRKYLRSVASAKSLPASGGIVADIGGVTKVADLGCGIGLGTAALGEMFPSAIVTGTNIGGIVQTEIAKRAGRRYGFAVVEDPAAVGGADLVFASEYFEHFLHPVEHLHDVIDALEPSAFLYANAFGSRSIGHFDAYWIEGEMTRGGATGRAFAKALRARGYRKIATTLWNSRPSYWRKV